MLDLLQISNAQLHLKGARKGTLQLPDGSEVYTLLPREDREPYACRWFFNELIYCQIAKELVAPVHPAGVFRAGDVIGLYRFRFGDRLIGLGFTAEPISVDPSPFQAEGYNINKYFDAVAPELFGKVVHEMRRLFLLDQLLWMLDRTPDNMLGIRSSDGRFLEIRSIDHEHCLALDGDAKHPRPSAYLGLSRCHPTQMTHFVDISSTGKKELLNSARALRNQLPVDKAQVFAEEGLVYLIQTVRLPESDSLRDHVKATLDLYRRLWETFENRVKDFVDRYAPLLVRCGRIP